MSPDKKWYLIHTCSDHEEKVRDALRQRIARLGMEDEFGDILIPSDAVSDPRAAGETPRRNELAGPGYIFVEMRMSERAWQLVKTTPKVTGVIGSEPPLEVPLPRIDDLRRDMPEGLVKPKPRLGYRDR